MKTIYKFFLALLCVVALNFSAFAGQTIVKTMPLGDGISTTGYVRLVVKVTDQHIGKDLGIVLHEEDPYAKNWDYGIGIMMFENVAATVENTSEIRGYDGNTPGWNLTAIKQIQKGTIVALWFAVDIANATHGLSVQTSTETAPAELYSGLKSRASQKSKPANNAKYCTVFFNDVAGSLGVNTAESIQILSDAQIVTSVEAFDFSTLPSAVKNVNNLNISVYPTLATEYLNIQTDEIIGSVKIYSTIGKTVYEGKADTKISVSDLQAGSYIVELKTIDNKIFRQNFLKK